MKIAVAQINPTIGDFDGNFAKIVSYAQKAKANACDLVIFPELAICGYPPRDLLEKKDFVATIDAVLTRMISEIHGIGVICGTVTVNPASQGNKLFNTGVLFENGTILHKTHKRLLPTYDVFDERRYFEPGADSRIVSFREHCLGLTVCEDIWNDEALLHQRPYAVDPATDLTEQGADIIINISASPYFCGKNDLRVKLLSGLARKFQVPFIYANQVGGNDSVLFDGVSTVYGADGSILARALDFEEDFIRFDTQSLRGDTRPVAASPAESVYKALVMGTRDYVHKCGFATAVIGLSGGIDSALTASIAVLALGAENVTTAFMPSKFTARHNYEDTEQLARNLGISLQTIPIDTIFKEFLTFVSPSFAETDMDVTEQNIQARIRGTILMALSNKTNCLLLTTGNKSELAVGYCTLYGDMNGGLAVISDVPKSMVWDISRFINRGKEIIPNRIIEKPPSAELKPDQTDQDDLPPYETIDAILAAYVEALKGPEEIIRMGYDPHIVADIIRRVDRNEYKRQQAAPGLKVTSKAFGYGRRQPIAQGYTGQALRQVIPH